MRKGDYCQNIDCLNNCSYPNGICDRSTGQCQCEQLITPYGPWDHWEGDDCSYLTPWCGSEKQHARIASAIVSVILILLMIM